MRAWGGGRDPRSGPWGCGGQRGTSRHQRETTPTWSQCFLHEAPECDQDSYFLRSLTFKINTKAVKNWCANNSSAVCKDVMKFNRRKAQTSTPGKEKSRLTQDMTPQASPRPAGAQAGTPHHELRALHLGTELWHFRRHPALSSKFHFPLPHVSVFYHPHGTAETHQQKVRDTAGELTGTLLTLNSVLQRLRCQTF